MYFGNEDFQQLKALLPKLGVLSVLAAMGAAFSGCGRAPSVPRVAPRPGPKAIVSTDGECSLTVPPEWAEDKDLYPGAELQISNKKEDLYIVALKEPKDDFKHMTLEKYSRITRRALAKSLKSSETTGPAKPVIGGVQALQYQIAGKLDGMEVIYLHTTIEGRKDYLQLLAWTQKAKFNTAKITLDKVLASFRVSLPNSNANLP